jgi:hypothetical protein
MGLADAMIRRAKFQDIPEIFNLMVEGHARSKYRDRDAIDAKEAKGLLMNAIQRHGLKREGGTCVFVTDEVDGFILGMLDRVYIVGTKLQARDVFYYCRPSAHPQDAIGLLGEYMAWAADVPNVIEVRASVTDIIGNVEKVEALYARCGFSRVGVVMERKIK